MFTSKHLLINIRQEKSPYSPAGVRSIKVWDSLAADEGLKRTCSQDFSCIEGRRKDGSKRMIRLILFLLIIYFIYAIYRKSQNPQIEPKVFSKSSCPSPKTFIDYTEGRINGKKKKAIDSHIAHCKDCQNALKGVFGMSTESGQKQVLDRTK